MQKNTPLSGNESLADLRSDTVTRPNAGMYEAMMSAPTGDDVYGDDETVNRLERHVADMLGKEDALYLSSGTQSNLVAMLCHCARGEEIIAGDEYHVSEAEARGASVLGGMSICELPTDEQGSLRPEQVSAAIKPDDVHYPVSRLLCLENTVSGNVQSPADIDALCQAGRDSGLSLHLDGARLMNASVALGVSVEQLVKPFDSISLCLSKGLGAPIGSVLSGSMAFIYRARRHRKLLGGGMRQAGILAAAGIYALENNIERLAEDHSNAEMLAEGLRAIPSIKVKQQTNMVFVELPHDCSRELENACNEQNIIISGRFPQVRLVTHLDVGQSAIERVVALFTRFFQAD